MLTALVLTSVVSAVAGTIAYLRGRSRERRGCPRCHGDLERGGSGLRCRPCGLYWTREGDPLGHTAADEQPLPRAYARPTVAPMAAPTPAAQAAPGGPAAAGAAPAASPAVVAAADTDSRTPKRS